MLRFQFPVDRSPHAGKAEQTAQGIGDGFCQEYAPDTQSHMRQQQDQGAHNDHLPQQREENSVSGVAKSLEHRLSHQHEGHEEKAEEIIKSDDAFQGIRRDKNFFEKTFSYITIGKGLEASCSDDINSYIFTF